jgi:hypothetical protein
MGKAKRKAAAKQAIVRRRANPPPKPPDRREIVRQAVEELNLSNAIESVLIQGDLAKLTTEERIDYYKAMCRTLGLNPLSQPFDYILFYADGTKVLKLYANKSCTEQLRQIHGVSVVPPLRKSMTQDMITVEADVRDRSGRTDTATGVVSLYKFKDGARVDYTEKELSNAIMKCETKAKRRATLSICGLAILDASELDTMEVIGGVTREGRVYEYPQIPERTGSREAAQEVARQKIEAHQKSLASSNQGEKTEIATASAVGSGSQQDAKADEGRGSTGTVKGSESRKAANPASRGKIELDWTNEASPIVRGDIAEITGWLEEKLGAKWGADNWWHIAPRHAETLRSTCSQAGFQVVEVMPPKSSAKAETATRPHHVPAPGKEPASEGNVGAPSPVVVSGTIERVNIQLKGDRQMAFVTLATKDGKKDAGVWDKSLIELLEKGKGKVAEVLITKRGQYSNITGLRKLGNVEFEKDGKTAILQQKDREPGSKTLW